MVSTFFKQHFKGDPVIWFSIIFLSFMGLLAVYSSTGMLAFAKHGGRTEYYLIKQTVFLVLGFALMFLFHRIDFRFFSRLSQWFIWFSIVLLVVTLIAGNNINEAKRTLTIPFVGFSFQTSDMAKLSLVMYIARYLSRYQDRLNEWKPFLSLLGVIIITCALIAPEDLSTALVLFLTSLSLLFIGNVRLKHLGALIGASALFLFLGTLFLLKAPETMLPKGRALTWKTRIENYMAGEKQDVYQTIQAKIAVANGGLLGKGPGNSMQKNTLPHPYSDFIYAIIIEEFGLIFGGLLTMLAFVIILIRSVRIVLKTPRAFGALLGVGISFTLTLQALFHMAVSVSLFPVTGLTLPLVSMGGTSILFTSFALGIILSVSRSVEPQ